MCTSWQEQILTPALAASQTIPHLNMNKLKFANTERRLAGIIRILRRFSHEGQANELHLILQEIKAGENYDRGLVKSWMIWRVRTRKDCILA